jgi:uncharacterized protein
MILTVPGLWNSGPEHWHTYWERSLPDCHRVVQRDWEAPVCSEWIATLDDAVVSAQQPVVLAAHSLACVTVAHWAAKYQRKIAGALLVGPSDIESPLYPKEAVGFGPVPMQRLPFPSVVVASSNDAWVTLDRAQQFASAWGSRFVNIGPAGHINSDSKMGEWPQGKALVAELLGLPANAFSVAAPHS